MEERQRWFLVPPDPTLCPPSPCNSNGLNVLRNQYSSLTPPPSWLVPTSTESRRFLLQVHQDRRFQLGRIVAMMSVNLQRRRADDLATSGKFGLQVLPFLRQCLVGPNVDMLHVPLQLEFKRLELIGSRDLLCPSDFNPDEHSSLGQVDPMVDARRENSVPFDHLQHFVHQAQADLAVAVVLDDTTDAVQVEPNWFFNDLDFHFDAPGFAILRHDSHQQHQSKRPADELRAVVVSVSVRRPAASDHASHDLLG